MATKKKAAIPKAVKTKAAKLNAFTEAETLKAFTEAETLKQLDEKGFSEMLDYARHILERDGLRMAIKALKSVIKLAKKAETGQGYATDVFAAAQSHWKQYYGDPEG